MSTTTTSSTDAQPRQLDRLSIPGMTRQVPGYDGGVNAMLVAFGLTVLIERNWLAKAGDVITVVRMPELVQLATYQLKSGDETAAHYFLSIDQEDLPDGEARLGYVVHYKDGGEDASYPLSVLVKTDLPGGKNNNPPFPGAGHSELKFGLSNTTVYPPDAIRGVTVTVEPYPQMHAWDTIHFHWGSLLVTHQVTGVGMATVFTLTHAQLIEGGDGVGLLTGFYIVDVVGNPSSERSPDTKVLVDLDSSKLAEPAFLTDDFPGLIDLERLDNRDLILEMYNSATIGRVGDIYDIDFRVYLALGGIIVHRGFEFITTAGRPVNHPVPHAIVRAAAGGRVEARYVLRKQNPPSDLYSRVAPAQVVGSIVPLDAPRFEQYPGHIVNPIPNSAVVDIPWYPWRKPTDEITLILRYVRGLNDVVVYSDEFVVGASWPDEAPVKRVIYRADLLRFNGYKPHLYYVINPPDVKSRSVKWNESERQLVQIGVPGR